MSRDRPSTSSGDRYNPKHTSRRPPSTGNVRKAAASAGATATKTKPGDSPKKPGTSRPKKKSFLRRRWWILVLATPFVLVLFAGIGLYIAYARIKLPDALPQPIQTTYLYDRNGHLIATLHGTVDRTVVPLQQNSPHLKDAVIATEDHDFYNHPGVDVAGVLRAAYTDLVKRETVQGASTITEQLVKNVYAGSYTTDENGVQSYTLPSRSIEEKIREGLLAIKLEQQMSKDQILANYLNTVYFGHGAYGIQAAAETYFGKPASQLTVLESASLAGVLHAPDLYDPINRPSDNWFRRNYAIDQMVRYGYLGKGQGARLKDRTCCGTIPDQTQRLVAPGQSEYFAEYVRQTLFDKYGEGEVYARWHEGHHHARPRSAGRGRERDQDRAARPTQRPGGSARRDGSPDGADPRDGRRSGLEQEPVQLRHRQRRLGPAVGLVVQGVHARGRDAAGLRPERVLERPVDDRYPAVP